MTKRKLNVAWVTAGIIIIFFVLYPLKVSLDVILNPEKAAIADSDINQYIKGWPAGGGVKESISYFDTQAKNQKIFVGTEGTFGLMPAGLDIFLGKNPNIKTQGYWPINDTPPADLIQASKTMPTYVIFYQPCPSCKFSGSAPATWPLKLISSIKKSDDTYYSVYQVVE